MELDEAAFPLLVPVEDGAVVMLIAG